MNNKINLPPFYIGQEVIALVNHSQGAYKKGDEFKVMGISKDCCKWVIDIGIHGIHGRSYCICGRTYPNNGIWLMNADRFAPKQQISYPLMSFKKIVKKEKEEILIPN